MSKDFSMWLEAMKEWSKIAGITMAVMCLIFHEPVAAGIQSFCMVSLPVAIMLTILVVVHKHFPIGRASHEN